MTRKDHFGPWRRELPLRAGRACWWWWTTQGQISELFFWQLSKKGGKEGNNCWRKKNYCTGRGGEGGALSGPGGPSKALWHPRPWSSQVSTFSPWFSESSKLLLLWASLNHTGKFTLMYCWSKFFIPICLQFSRNWSEYCIPTCLKCSRNWSQVLIFFSFLWPGGLKDELPTWINNYI